LKVVTIFLANGKCISVKDQDDSDLLNYSKKLSDLLQSNNVTILHTSESSVIVRPSKVQAVLVDEEKQEGEVEEVQHSEIQEAIEEPQESEDIISD